MAKEIERPKGYIDVPADVLRERVQKGPWQRDFVRSLRAHVLEERAQSVVGGELLSTLTHRGAEIVHQEHRKATLYKKLLEVADNQTANYFFKQNTKIAYGIIIPVPQEDELGSYTDRYLVALYDGKKKEVLVVEPSEERKKAGGNLNLFHPIQNRHYTASDNPIQNFMDRFTMLGMSVVLDGRNMDQADELDHVIQRSVAAVEYRKYTLKAQTVVGETERDLASQGETLHGEAVIFLHESDAFEQSFRDEQE